MSGARFYSLLRPYAATCHEPSGQRALKRIQFTAAFRLYILILCLTLSVDKEEPFSSCTIKVAMLSVFPAKPLPSGSVQTKQMDDHKNLEQIFP